MSVVFQFQLPVSYEQYQAMNKLINPENLAPPGCSLHIISQNEGVLTVTDIWDDEAEGKAFYQATSQKVGMPFPPVTISEVKELMF